MAFSPALPLQHSTSGALGSLAIPGQRCMHVPSTACGAMVKGNDASASHHASHHLGGSLFGVEHESFGWYRAALYLLNEVRCYTMSWSFVQLLAWAGSSLLSSGA